MRNDKGQFIKGHSLGEATRFGKGNTANVRRCHITGRMISRAEADARAQDQLRIMLSAKEDMYVAFEMDQESDLREDMIADARNNHDRAKKLARFYHVGMTKEQETKRKAERVEFLLETVDHLQSVVESAFKELDAYEFDTDEARAASSLIGEAEQQIIDAKAELDKLGFVMKSDQVIMTNMPGSMGKTRIIDMGMASELKTTDTSRMNVNIVLSDEKLRPGQYRGISQYAAVIGSIFDLDKDAQTIEDMIATDGLRIREEAHDGPVECRTVPEGGIEDRVPATLAMWAEDVDGAYSDRMNARAYAEACRETDEDNAGVDIPDWLLNGNEEGEQIDPDPRSHGWPEPFDDRWNQEDRRWSTGMAIGGTIAISGLLVIASVLLVKLIGWIF